MDLRMIKTRRDIRNALLDLLDDNRSFESITVSQIPAGRTSAVLPFMIIIRINMRC